MQFSLSHLIVFAAGIAAGALVIYLSLRGKLAVAEAKGRAAGDVERTALTEQLKAATQESGRLENRLREAEEGARQMQADLEKAGRESAQYAERANRVPELEQALKQVNHASEQLANELSTWREASGRLTAERDGLQQQLTTLTQAREQLSGAHGSLLGESAALRVKIAELNTALENERTQAQEKLALLNGAREQLSNQFKALANDILEDKAKKFTDQNKANLGQLLDPLKQQLVDFKTKIEEVYVNEGKDRSALTAQVKQLMQLNQSLSQEAQNLTLALKGDRKAQGDFGEIILDDVLERAGLRPGQHYERQGSVKSEDGLTRVIPDVVIHLPGDRHLVVDSKMTLPDYSLFAAAETEEARTEALRRHLGSIRAHIKGLAEKNYQSLYGLKSLDFVVMFIPLEPAFMVAVTNDRELFQQAWDKNVLLVSPSTLLFVVRTVAYLWRQEDLSRNAKEISNRGAELYDKLVGFVNDLQKVGERIQQAQDSYKDACKKLSDGKGNVISQAQKLKDLGVKPSKSLPDRWIGTDTEEPTPALAASASGGEAADKG